MKKASFGKRMATRAVILVSYILLVILAIWPDSRYPKVLFNAAGNSSRGFEKIIFVNHPYRKDNANIMSLESHYSGIEYLTSKEADYYESKSDKNDLPSVDVACALSHMNVWKLVLEKGWASVLILESDVTWDENIKNISKRAAKGLDTLINEKRLRQGGSQPSPQDPYNVEQWDYFSWGTCFDEERFEASASGIYVKYPDVDSPNCEYGWPEDDVNDTLVDERIMRKAGFPICTNAYALTAKGAEKLLLRKSLFSNGSVDLKMAQEIDKGNLVGYEMFPPPMYQWRYVGDTGADGLNPDIASEERQEENISNIEEKWSQSQDPSFFWEINHRNYPWPYKHWVLNRIAENMVSKNTSS